MNECLFVLLMLTVASLIPFSSSMNDDGNQFCVKGCVRFCDNDTVPRKVRELTILKGLS